MNRIWSAVVAAVLLTALPLIVGGAATQAASAMRITRATAKPTTVTPKSVVTFTVTVRGIRLSAKSIGKRPVSGEGHLQYYLDRIPKDAWTHRDLRGSYLAAVGTPVLLFGLRASPVPLTRGTHHVLIALARNDGILYRAPTASVTIKVK